MTTSAKYVSAIAAAAMIATMPFSPALAQSGGIPVVRDAEIERLVRDYARPIFAAAGLSKQGIEIVLVNDTAFNAFVSGRRLFINTGAIETAESPNEIIGVIAHEAGHIAGGHQERMRQQLDVANKIAMIGSLVGLGAVAAGAATNNSGLAGVGSTIAMGSSGSAMRNFLSYQRTEESTADQSALVYLDGTGQSARGMVKTMERFSSALSLSGTRIDPYLSSHPMPRDRLLALRSAGQASKFWDKRDAPALQERHDLARAKIAAYTEGRNGLRKIARSLRSPIAAEYGQALIAHLYGKSSDAQAKVDKLLKQRPKNPYFQELRGDILVKANKPEAAATAYGKATKLGEESSLILIARGQALLGSGRKKDLQEAVRLIRRGLAQEPENPMAYRFLAQAYGGLGDIGAAELATAEGNYFAGNLQEARIFAARAQTKLSKGSPAWLRAQDIIDSKPAKPKR